MRPRALAVAVLVAGPAGAAAAPTQFGAGSLVIPMDEAYQNDGMLQAYGLVFELLRHGVPVAWAIDVNKTYHAAPCDTPGDECAWDCAVEGSGVKCPYPTSSPDFFAATTIVWGGTGAIASHGYRGGPFVIDAPHRDAALAVIDVWNDPATWTANPWADRSVFELVAVHEATATFTADVSRDLLAAPTIAVFSDGNEDIATAYLRAAGIKQSNGNEFPAARCGGPGTCGPGTPNPDMLTVPSVAGDMGTCGAPNADHENGALFTADGVPAYCQIMSMHWNVTDRETVECGGGDCGATQDDCPPSTPITYHGHEVVAEVRSFLAYPVHFFAECQAVNAYENTTPNPAWPFLDDEGRDGHFLTTEGTPPACPCTEPGFSCVTGGCNGADCCLPQDIKEQGAGFLIAARPDTYRVFHPEVPYNQLDGAFETIGGSEPAYNLSTYLGTTYKNDRQVTFISGPNGPGVEDIWMTGYLDGTCDITEPIEKRGAKTDTWGPEACSGKISYLGGHAYDDVTPMTANTQSQGARLFLNALFEADCVTTVGQPVLGLGLAPLVVGAQTLPVTVDVTATYDNTGRGAALASALHLAGGAGVEVVAAAGGTIAANTATWDVGSISGLPVHAGDPLSNGGRTATLAFAAFGDYTVTVDLAYRVGVTDLVSGPATFTIHVASDTDGDGVPDELDPFPDDPGRCGDTDDDTCDDCTNGLVDPRNDGPDADADGICDAGEGNPGTGDGGGCCDSSGQGAPPLVAVLLVLLAATRPRCARSRRRAP
jgi:uncharacterized protein (TIGR03382 family)